MSQSSSDLLGLDTTISSMLEEIEEQPETYAHILCTETLNKNGYFSVPHHPECDSPDVLFMIPDCAIYRPDPTIGVSDLYEDTSEQVSVSCTCNASKCLKLYCDCFSRSLYCGNNCKCTGCNNTSSLSDCVHIKNSKNMTRERNPNAFKRSKEYDDIVSCNCKRTRCQKKYCECYQAGVACSADCTCIGCMNGNQMVWNLNELPTTSY
jgi:hypothetical protein